MAKTYNMMKVGILLVSFQLLVLVKLGVSDINKDKAECSNQLVGLSTCLPYVGGEAKAPTRDCCTGIKQVMKDSKKCLCILVKDRNDPSLGLNVNATLALSLPEVCHQPKANVSECADLLHLSPNSPETKVFSDFGKAAAPSSAISASSGKSTGGGGATSAKETSDSAKGKKWLIAQMFCGGSLYLVFCLTPCLLI